MRVSFSLDALKTPRPVRPKQTTLCAAACAALLACISALGGCHGRDAQRGAALYSENCASCHGADGRGQNPARPQGSIAPEQEGWIAPALDMRGHCYQHPRKELIGMIRNGSALQGSTMVGFKSKLSDEQIGAVVTYLETLWDLGIRKQYQARDN